MSRGDNNIKEPQLWSRGKIVASHTAGPGSIPGRVNFLVVSTPVAQWLSYSPLDPRFAGSIPVKVDGFF